MPRPSSPTAANSAWGPRSESRPASCTRAVPWAPSSSPATNTSCAAAARCDRESETGRLVQHRALRDLSQLAHAGLHPHRGLGRVVLQLRIVAMQAIIHLGLQILLMPIHLHLQIFAIELAP